MPQSNFTQVSYTYLHSLACPYQAFLRYEGRMRVKPTIYLALGNSLHYVLEKAYEPVTFDNEIKEDHYALTMSVEDAAKLFLWDLNRQIEEDDIFLTYPQMKKAQADGQEMLVRYYDQAEQGLIDPHPIGIEKEFKLPIAGINIVGKIDKIERSPEGLVVIDYKSGAKKPNDWNLRRSLQFSAYAWACNELYGEFPVKVVWHHLRTGERLEGVRTEWDIEQLQRIVSAAVYLQQNDIRYRIYHDQVCGQCDFAGEGKECDDPELEQQILDKRDVRVTTANS